MAARQSNAPAVHTEKSYDPEIQDMASYIHDYKVDSDLAVSWPQLGKMEHRLTLKFDVRSLTLPVWCS